MGFQIAAAVFSRRQVADHRAETFPVVEINVTGDQVVLLLEAWLFQIQQRVVQRLDFKRPVEAFHRGVVMAVARSRKTVRQSHSTDQIPETTGRIDAAAVAVEQGSWFQSSEGQNLQR